jgi:hypothetical protein
MSTTWVYTASITITPGSHLQLRDTLNATLAELKDQGLIVQATWQLRELDEEDDAPHAYL